MRTITLVLFICFFVFSAGAAVTNYYSGATGSLSSLSTWWTNTNGTGSHPSSFTNNNQVFNIINNATPTITANWTVSGANSKIVLGDGVNNINFTIPTSFSVTSTIDVAANATLTIMNTSVPTMGTLSASSTVSYSASGGGQSVKSATYGNLYIGNSSGTQTASGDIVVNGALTTTSGGTLAMAANRLSGTLASLTNNGTITTSATDNPPIPAGKNWSGTTGEVNFAATTGGQSIPAGTYKTLINSNTSGTNTAVGALVITTTFTTSAGGTFALGTNTISGSLTNLTNNGTITTTNTSSLPLPSGRDWSGTGSAGGVRFAVTGGGQTVPVGTYGALTLANSSGSDTTAGAITVNGALTTTNGGIFDMGMYQLNGNPTVTNNGTVSTECTVNPAIPAGETWGGTTGLVKFAATGGNQYIPGGTYKTLTCSNTTDTNTVTGDLNITGTITTTGSGGTLNMGTNTLAAVGVTNSGTILTQNTSSAPLPSGLTWTGEVNYNGTGNQTLVTGTFPSLTLSGARASTPVITLASGSITVSGSFNVIYTGAVSFVTTGNTFTYSTNTAQTVGGITYNNLTLANSAGAAPKTAGGNVTVNGTLTTTSGGTFALGNYQLLGALTTVTNNGAISTTCTVNPAMPSGKSWSGTTGLVTFAATDGNQYIPGGTYKTLTCNNASDTNTAVGNINVTGTITTTGGGVLNMGTNTLVAVALSHTGTILTQNTSSEPLPTGKTWAGQVVYNGTGSQTLVTGTYADLALSGARASTPTITLASGSISVSGSFLVSYTGAVSFATTGNTFTYTGNTSQTVGGITYNNLSFANTAGTSIKTAGGNMTVNGTLTTTSNGIFSMSDYQLSGSLPTITNNGTITTTCTVNPALATGKNWGGTGTVIFAATGGRQYIPGGTFATLTCSNTSDTNTVTGGKLTVTGTLVTSGAGGTLSMSTFELNAGTITNNATGTLLTRSTSLVPIPSARSYAGTVCFASATGGQNIPQGTYNNLSIANTSDTSTAAGNLTINATLTMVSGGTLKMGANTISGGAGFATAGGGTITTANTTSTPLKAGRTWAQTIVYNAATGSQTVVAGSYNGGLVNANTSGTNTAGGNMDITGSLTLATGSTLNDGGFGITLNGNIAGTGTHTSTGSGVITMATGGGTISGATLGNLTLNNSGGFSLGGNATVNGTLTLSSGKLSLGSNNLILGTSAPAVAGSLSSSNMIVINGTGQVRKLFTANGSYLFPIGDNTPTYSPVTITFTGGTYAAGAYAGFKVTNTKHPNDPSATNYLKRYWSLSTSGITSPVYNISNATYADADIVGDEASISSAQYNGSLPWIKYSTVNAATNTVSMNGVTATSADFCGIASANASVSVLPNTASICSGNNVGLVATGTGVPPFTYTWSPATGLSATTGASVTAAPTTGTVSATYIYTVTMTDNTGVTATATATVTVQPTSAVITGDSTLCNSATTTLSNALPGGSWSSSNTSVATVGSSTGVVSASSAGTAVITYSLSGGCNSTRRVTVNPLPSAGTITGASVLCEAATTSFSDIAAGGNWSSGNPAVATINTGSGLATGISAGTASLSYTVANVWGCSASATKNITVNPLPHAGAITGTPSVCFGTTTQLNNLTTGGQWLSVDSTLASVDTAGSVTGTIGVAWDTSVSILYIATNGCGADTAQRTVTIKGLPGVGVMVATNNHQVCLGAQVSYSSTHPGGVWSTSDTTIASIDSLSGQLTGVSVGSTTISYTVTGSNGCSKSRLGGITVNPLPPVPTIYTDGLACTGSSVTLTGTTGPASHKWTSSDMSVATIDSNTGVLMGQSVGTAIITYEYKEACSNYAQTVITVNPTTTASVTGTAVVCSSGGTTTLAGSPAGGTWSSSNTLRATVDDAGLITGGGIGSATISYVYTNSYGCDSRVNTLVSVNPLPTVGSIAGASGICPDATSVYTNPTADGVWSTSDASIATVGSSSGIVTGVAPGTMVVSYTVTGSNGCAKSSKLTVTVNELPYVSAIIAGTGRVCAGSTLPLTDTTSGTHLWTSSNTGVATVNSSTGLVSGVSAGTAIISYRYTSGCSNYATTVVTVDPIATWTVTGSTTVCAGGSTTTLGGTPDDGVWSSSYPSRASVDSTSGLITGLTAGTSVITYTYTNEYGCVSKSYTTVTVNAQPSVAAISGASSVCEGVAATFTNATAGGAWSSLDEGVATIGTSGIVTGIGAGSTVISYSVTGVNGCVKAVAKAVTVNALPYVSGIMAGAGTLCAGTTLTLTNATSGTHLWTSDNVAAATVNASTGIVTGVAAGTATISYKYTTSCSSYATTIVTVLPVTTASVSGTQVVCAGGSTITLTGAPGSGVWYSSAPTKASVDSTSGIVTGLTAGTSIITFKYTNGSGCSYRVYTTVTVNALPAVAGISGASSVCAGSTIALTNATTGGTWSSSAAGIGSVGASGIVTGVSAGTAKISYTVTGANGCNANAVKTITVNALPTVSAIVAGSGSVTAGATLALSNATGGTHLWSSSNTSAATVHSGTGLVTGIAPGTAIISYAFTLGCTNYATTVVTVNAGAKQAAVETEADAPHVNTEVRVYPNPTSGTFSIKSDGGYLSVYSLEGKAIAKYEVQAGVSVLSMPSGLAAGVYVCIFSDDSGNRELIRLEYRP